MYTSSGGLIIPLIKSAIVMATSHWLYCKYRNIKITQLNEPSTQLMSSVRYVSESNEWVFDAVFSDMYIL